MITVAHLNQALDASLWPRFDAISPSDSAVEIRFSVPHDLSYFDGHFPQQAVLPGVVQVHWVGELAKRFFGVDGFTDLKSVKFNSMILPGNRVTLSLRYNSDKGSVRFEYANEGEKFSSGALHFLGANN